MHNISKKISSNTYTRGQLLPELLQKRILVLDGAMGTMIQQYKLSEADFRGNLPELLDHPIDLKGNNELLSITKPEVILEIHQQYLAAGADIIETNTFGATPDKPRFVAGAIGPTPKTASISPDVNDPGARNVDFETLRQAYYDQVESLVEGGVDLILVETIFDTLNAKAALFAIDEFFENTQQKLPLMISGTVTDASGRILSGQTVEAFWNSLRHAKPILFGLNCALGATLMKPYIAELAKICDTAVSCYPNAGLPNPMSDTGFDETPEITSHLIDEFSKDGLVNLVGGCCGTTPAHIAAIAKSVQHRKPRKWTSTWNPYKEQVSE